MRRGLRSAASRCPMLLLAMTAPVARVVGPPSDRRPTDPRYRVGASSPSISDASALLAVGRAIRSTPQCQCGTHPCARPAQRAGTGARYVELGTAGTSRQRFVFKIVSKGPIAARWVMMSADASPLTAQMGGDSLLLVNEPGVRTGCGKPRRAASRPYQGGSRRAGGPERGTQCHAQRDQPGRRPLPMRWGRCGLAVRPHGRSPEPCLWTGRDTAAWVLAG